MSILLVQGNTLSIPLADKSVLFYQSKVEIVAPLPIRLADGYIFVRKSHVLYGDLLPILADHDSFARYLCSVFPGIGLEIAETKNGLSLFLLYFQVRYNGFKDRCRLLVASCPAIKQPSAIGMGLLFVICSAESVGNKLYSLFIDHPNLYSSMIRWVYKPLTFIRLSPFYSDVGLSVHETSNISNIRICHGINSYSVI